MIKSAILQDIVNHNGGGTTATSTTLPALQKDQHQEVINEPPTIVRSSSSSSTGSNTTTTSNSCKRSTVYCSSANDTTSTNVGLDHSSHPYNNENETNNNDMHYKYYLNNHMMMSNNENIIPTAGSQTTTRDTSLLKQQEHEKMITNQKSDGNNYNKYTNNSKKDITVTRRNSNCQYFRTINMDTSNRTASTSICLLCNMINITDRYHHATTCQKHVIFHQIVLQQQQHHQYQYCLPFHHPSLPSIQYIQTNVTDDNIPIITKAVMCPYRYTTFHLVLYPTGTTLFYFGSQGSNRSYRWWCSSTSNAQSFKYNRNMKTNGVEQQSTLTATSTDIVHECTTTTATVDISNTADDVSAQDNKRNTIIDNDTNEFTTAMTRTQYPSLEDDVGTRLHNDFTQTYRSNSRNPSPQSNTDIIVSQNNSNNSNNCDSWHCHLCQIYNLTSNQFWIHCLTDDHTMKITSIKKKKKKQQSQMTSNNDIDSTMHPLQVHVPTDDEIILYPPLPPSSASSLDYCKNKKYRYAKNHEYFFSQSSSGDNTIAKQHEEVVANVSISPIKSNTLGTKSVLSSENNIPTDDDDVNVNIHEYIQDSNKCIISIDTPSTTVLSPSDSTNEVTLNNAEDDCTITTKQQGFERIYHNTSIKDESMTSRRSMSKDRGPIVRAVTFEDDFVSSTSTSIDTNQSSSLHGTSLVVGCMAQDLIEECDTSQITINDQDASSAINSTTSMTANTGTKIPQISMFNEKFNANVSQCFVCTPKASNVTITDVNEVSVVVDDNDDDDGTSIFVTQNSDNEYWSCKLCDIVNLQGHSVDTHCTGKKHRLALENKLRITSSSSSFVSPIKAEFNVGKSPRKVLEECLAFQIYVDATAAIDPRYSYIMYNPFHSESSAASWSCHLCRPMIHGLKMKDVEPHCLGKKHTLAFHESGGQSFSKIDQPQSNDDDDNIDFTPIKGEEIFEVSDEASSKFSGLEVERRLSADMIRSVITDTELQNGQSNNNLSMCSVATYYYDAMTGEWLDDDGDTIYQSFIDDDSIMFHDLADEKCDQQILNFDEIQSILNQDDNEEINLSILVGEEYIKEIDTNLEDFCEQLSLELDQMSHDLLGDCQQTI